MYTPHIDALAKSGIVFTQFYAGAPICSPSRAALLTGLNPHAAGLPSNSSSIPGGSGLPTDKITMAEVLKERGYSTAHIGKWHLGFNEETMPNMQGFDYSFGHMGGCIDNYSHFFYWNGPNRHDLYENGQEVFHNGVYFQNLMEQKANAFIKNNANRPFFMYYAMNLPHYPLQGTEHWRKYYKDLEQPRKDYASCISVIDQKIGALIETLSQENILQNTIIIFQSDHGHSVEERAFNGGGNAGIYRGAKTSLFEGGIRVPAIISWLRHIPSNETRNQVSISMDWFATIMDYCEIVGPPIEGKSLRNIIEKESAPSNHEFLIWKQGIRWAIRKDEWKLLGFPNDPTDKMSIDPSADLLFLSNIERDPSEQINFAFDYPEIKDTLLSEYLNWKYATIDDVPILAKNITSKALGANIELASHPNPKYIGGGSNSLIDEKCGSRYFNDGRWLGFQTDDLEATIDLKESTDIQSIQIGLLQDASSWIFYPTSIRVAFSNNAIDFSEEVEITLEEMIDMNKKKIKRVDILLNETYVRFIKVKIKNRGTCPDWHPNKGGKAWLFIDEITVQ